MPVVGGGVTSAGSLLVDDEPPQAVTKRENASASISNLEREIMPEVFI
jgi:hypothetical protein